MQIVIDIDDEEYQRTMRHYKSFPRDLSHYERNIVNGTPLPKGHGRLVDADKLKMELERGIRAGNYEEGYEKYAHINDMDDCIDAVVYADTIIEADTEVQDADNG